MAHSSMHQEFDIQSEVLLQSPKMVRVVLLNDDYTTIDFVVDVLEKIFSKSHSEALRITYEVHQKGKGTCGTYPYDIGETKVQETIARAQLAEFPLKVYAESID